jgi:hypothetical protein
MSGRKPRLEWTAAKSGGGSRAVRSADGIAMLYLCVDRLAINDFDWGISPGDDFTAMETSLECDHGERTLLDAQLAAEAAALKLLRDAVAALEGGAEP